MQTCLNCACEKSQGRKKLSFGAYPTVVRRQVDILELKDLEREYILSRSRLTLAQHHPPSAAVAGMPETYTTHPCTQASWFNGDNQNLVACPGFLCRQRVS